jgi:RNA polymerase sigma factor (TIGR02999 family)
MVEESETPERANVTALLHRMKDGDDEARDELAPFVYAELKRRAQALMRREGNAHSVQATMLVNDAFMQLVDADNVDWESRGHFFALASRLMRRVLVDRARARARDKRGGDAVHLNLEETVVVSVARDEDVLRVEEALQSLAEVDPRHAEIVTMRFFGGMTVEEIATTLGMSKRNIEREWTFIKAWLRRALSA